MSQPQSIRGDVFCDRFGGLTEIFLAGASILIVAIREQPGPMDAVLAGLFLLEVIGAVLIMFSRLPQMRWAVWLFGLRVLGGLAYMGAVHGDKLAQRTFGFPVLVLLYCFMRVRALREL